MTDEATTVEESEAADPNARRETTKTPPMKTIENLPPELKKKVAEDAQAIAQDGTVSGALQVLRDARRLYEIGLTALNRMLDDKKVSNRDAVEAWLVASMTHASQQEFQRADVAADLQKVILPFVGAECQLEAQREAKERVDEAKAAIAKRAEQEVEVGRQLIPDHGTRVPRNIPIVLIGNREVVETAISTLVLLTRASSEEEADDSKKVATIHWHAALGSNHSLTAHDKYYVPIRGSRWVGQATSPKQAADIIAPHLRQTFKHRVDLLLIDDLGQAHKTFSYEEPGPRSAGKAQKVLRKVTETLGCALVAGLPVDIPPNDPDEKAPPPEWEQLMKYTQLIHLYRDEEKIVGVQLNDTLGSGERKGVATPFS